MSMGFIILLVIFYIAINGGVLIGCAEDWDEAELYKFPNGIRVKHLFMFLIVGPAFLLFFIISWLVIFFTSKKVGSALKQFWNERVF